MIYIIYFFEKKFNEETKLVKDTVENKLRKNKKEIQGLVKETETRINEAFRDYEENFKKFNLVTVPPILSLFLFVFFSLFPRASYRIEIKIYLSVRR